MPVTDAIIVDEAHYFAGPKSQMTKSLLHYVKGHNVKYMLMLTATPYLSTPWNIFTLARQLGHHWSYFDFRNRFFQDRYIGKRIVPEVRPGIEDDIAEMVRKIGDIVKIDDCFDVPQQTFEVEYIKLTKKQEKAKANLLETNPIVRFVRYHQIENGTLKSDGYVKDEFYANDKIERIIELCRQHKKIAIVARYNLQIEHIKRELEAEGLGPIFVIQGKTKNRDQVGQDAEAAERAIVIINASCSEG